VTGVERSGYAMDVQKIELVHPDGTTEVMVETDTTGAGLVHPGGSKQNLYKEATEGWSKQRGLCAILATKEKL